MIRANWPIGYYVDNEFLTKGDFDRFGYVSRECGFTLTGCEWIDWFGVQPCKCKKTGGSSRYGGCNATPNPKQAKKFSETMNSYGLTVMWTMENRNACACRDQPDSWRDLQLKRILKHWSKFGRSILFEPFSEPWVKPDGTEAWVRRVAPTLPPEVRLIVPDRDGNKGSGSPRWTGLTDGLYNTVHPASVGDALSAMRFGQRVLVVTDHSGTLDPGAENCAKLAKESARTKAGLLIYRFEGQPREDSMRAMGAEIRL